MATEIQNKVDRERDWYKHQFLNVIDCLDRIGLPNLSLGYAYSSFKDPLQNATEKINKINAIQQQAQDILIAENDIGVIRDYPNYTNNGFISVTVEVYWNLFYDDSDDEKVKDKKEVERRLQQVLMHNHPPFGSSLMVCISNLEYYLQNDQIITTVLLGITSDDVDLNWKNILEGVRNNNIELKWNVLFLEVDDSSEEEEGEGERGGYYDEECYGDEELYDDEEL